LQGSWYRGLALPKARHRHRKSARIFLKINSTEIMEFHIYFEMKGFETGSYSVCSEDEDAIIGLYYYYYYYYYFSQVFFLP
jgi:hypothetical protein